VSRHIHDNCHFRIVTTPPYLYRGCHDGGVIDKKSDSSPRTKTGVVRYRVTAQTIRATNAKTVMTPPMMTKSITDISASLSGALPGRAVSGRRGWAPQEVVHGQHHDHHDNDDDVALHKGQSTPAIPSPSLRRFRRSGNTQTEAIDRRLVATDPLSWTQGVARLFAGVFGQVRPRVQILVRESRKAVRSAEIAHARPALGRGDIGVKTPSGVCPRVRRANRRLVDKPRAAHR
jgi:hypothetical protein